MRTSFRVVGATLLAIFGLKMVGTFAGTITLAVGGIAVIAAYHVLAQQFPGAKKATRIAIVGLVTIGLIAAFLGPYAGFSSASFRRFVKDRDVRVATDLMPPALGSRASALNEIQEVDDIASTRDTRELEAVKTAYKNGRIPVDSAYRAIGRILGRAKSRAGLIEETKTRLDLTASSGEAGSANRQPASSTQVVEVGAEWVTVTLPYYSNQEYKPDRPIEIRLPNGRILEGDTNGQLFKADTLVQGFIRIPGERGAKLQSNQVEIRSKGRGTNRVAITNTPYSHS